jgi:hypothetical protein
MEEPRSDLNIVDDDRRRQAGQEGCRVELGTSRFTGEGEGCASMGRKERMGKMGFSGASWACDDKCGWQRCSVKYGRSNGSCD